MPFKAEAHHEIVINGAAYEIAEHPAAPGMPYGQEGRQAVVYRIFLKGAAEKGNGTSFALKVFKPHFRLPSLVSLTERLGRYASIPGLSVCKRTVITPRNNADLLASHPDLIYSVVMPWMDGPTWMEVMLDGKGLPMEMSLHIARSFADQLSYMEEYGTAHCDISGPNLLIPALADPPSTEGPPVALVDVEQLYGPSLERPEALPGGSPGYAHRTAPEGLWSAAADRFAGALLLSEMLGVCDRRVMDASWGENYFDPGEVQKPGSTRFDTLLKVLQENWGAAAGELLRRAWCSESLTECPTLGEWLMVLQKQESVKPGTVKGAETADLPAASQAPPEQEAKAPVPPERPQPSDSSLYASPVAAVQAPPAIQQPEPPSPPEPARPSDSSLYTSPASATTAPAQSPSQSGPTAPERSLSCLSCSASLSADMLFCSQCGAAVQKDSKTEPQKASASTKMEPPKTSPPAHASAPQQAVVSQVQKPQSPEPAKPPEAPAKDTVEGGQKKAGRPGIWRLVLAVGLLVVCPLIFLLTFGVNYKMLGLTGTVLILVVVASPSALFFTFRNWKALSVWRKILTVTALCMTILPAGAVAFFLFTGDLFYKLAVICSLICAAAVFFLVKPFLTILPHHSGLGTEPDSEKGAGKKAGMPLGWKIAIAAAALLILVSIAKTVICYDLADNYEKKGRELLNSGKSDEALELLNRSIALKPGRYGYSLRANAYCQRGDYQNALADYTRAGSYADTFGRGIAYYRTGDYDKAIADFSKAIESDDGSCYGHSYGKKADDNPEKYLFRGKAYCEKGDFEKALADFKMEKPRRSEVNYVDYVGPDDTAGDFAFTQKIESYDRAIGSYPESAAGYYGRGLAYYEHLDYDKALSDLKKAESMGYKVNWSYLTNLKK